MYQFSVCVGVCVCRCECVWVFFEDKLRKVRAGRQNEMRENSNDSICVQSCTQLLSAPLRLPFARSPFQREGWWAKRDSLQQMVELCSAEVRNSPLGWPKITACLLFSSQPWVHLTRLGLCLAWSSLCNHTVAADKNNSVVVICSSHFFLAVKISNQWRKKNVFGV